jgi:hypothetical protein
MADIRAGRQGHQKKMQHEGRDLERKTEHRQTTESREIERERQTGID